jgi:type II secretory pathway pseudopilin PulG
MAVDIRQRLQVVGGHRPDAAGPRGIRVPDLVFAIGTVSLVLVGLGLLAVPVWHASTLRAKASAVLDNAATLQLAAETYAAGHQGRYADDVLDLLPYLPRDSAPRNPYTGRGIVFGGGPGDLTYGSPIRGQDYVIRAWAVGPGGKRLLVGSLSGRRERQPAPARKDDL